MEKHSESRLSYLFAHLHLLSSDLFSSDSSHLCFSTVHIVGSIASKLPSINAQPNPRDSKVPSLKLLLLVVVTVADLNKGILHLPGFTDVHFQDVAEKNNN